MSFLRKVFARIVPVAIPPRRLIPSAVVLIVGTALSLGLFAELWKEESLVRDATFLRLAEARFAALEKSLATALGELHALEGLFAASREVTRVEFGKFVAHLTARAGAAQAFEWIPRVTDDRRAAFESAARADGFSDFQFKERESPEKMVRAAQRAEYFPVYYVEPLRGNEAALGFDLGSEPTRLAALRKARDTGRMVTSARITLVQDTGKQFGFLVFLPVFAGGGIPATPAGRVENLAGFVLGVFRVGAIVGPSEPDLADSDPGLRIYVFDVSAPAGSQLLFPKGAAARKVGDVYFALSLEKSINIGDRSWKVVIAPRAGTIEPLWEPWAALAGSLLLVALLSLYLFFDTVQRLRLGESEGRFRVFLDNSPSAILMKKPDGSYLFGNRLWHEWFSPANSEIEAKSLPDFFPDEHTASVRELDERVVKEGLPVSTEIMTPLASGKTIPTILQKFPIFGVSGELLGIGGINTDISERKQMELELTRVSEDLTRLIDTANAPIFGVDTGGKINEWNRMIASITGYDKQEVIGRDLVELLIPDQFKEVGHKLIADGLAGKTLTNWQALFLTKDGRTLEMLLNSTTRVDNEGRVVGVVGIGQDITELNQVRRERERVADDLTALIDTANAPIFGVDTKGNINEWNRMVARISGYEKEDVLGRNLVELLIPDQSKKAVREVIAKGLAGTETANYEVPILTRKGEIVEVLLNSTTRKDANGNIAGVVGIGQDITERNQVEREKNRLVALVESSSDFFGMCEPDGRVFFVNQAGRRLIGLSAGPSADLYRMENFLPKNVSSKFFDEMFPQISEGGEWRGVLALRHFLTGEALPVEMTVFGILDPASGKLAACATVCRDIRERLAAEERQAELRKTVELSDKMASLGQLAAGVAHEINNPIGFINSNLKTAQEYVGELQKLIGLQNELERKLDGNAKIDGGGVRKMLGSIKTLKKKIDFDFIMDDHPKLLADSLEGAERVIGIVASMRTFSHVDQGVPGEADINKGIENTLKLVWNEIKYKATVKKNLGPVGIVVGYPQQLNQVFLNLFVNAAQAIEKQGEIEISTGMENDHVVIRVKDTGRGIAPEALEHIFEPFFTTKDIGEGTGLGLSVSYNIIQKHHGTLEVASEPGRGTVFTVKLPVKSQRAKARGLA